MQARQFIRGYSETSAFTVGAVRVTNLAHGAAVAATDTCEVSSANLQRPQQFCAPLHELEALQIIHACNWTFQLPRVALMSRCSPPQVEFKSIPEEVVDQLVAEGTCYSCAGGLMVEHPLVRCCPCAQQTCMAPVLQQHLRGTCRQLASRTANPHSSQRSGYWTGWCQSCRCRRT